MAFWASLPIELALIENETDRIIHLGINGGIDSNFITRKYIRQLTVKFKTTSYEYVETLFMPECFFFCTGCKTVKFNEDSYAWKSFDNADKNQSVNFENYKSPNSRVDQDPHKIGFFATTKPHHSND